MRGKGTLVTDGAKGMGAAHSRLIAARGGAVIVADIDEAGEALADEIRGSGADARFVRLDVTSEEQWRAVIDEAIARDGRIDALIHNAGVATVKPITENGRESGRERGCQYVEIPVVAVSFKKKKKTN